jgi:parallel beta-helix repeat protein
MLSIVLNWLKRIPWLIVFAFAAIAAVLSFALERINIPPRELSPYIERRASGHNPLIVDFGSWVGQTLLKLDRGASQPHPLQMLRIGAQAHTTPPSAAHDSNAAIVLVSSPGETIRAIAQARPGDVITLLPGTYRFGRGYVAVSQAGTETARITVRAERPGTVFLEFNTVEGFKVFAPYWTFENLHIRGTCQDHTDCEHAFHIVGKAAHFVARNNTIVDFNAHFKINAENQAFPDYGLIEGNTLTNTSVRETANPVTSIDMVAVSHWQMRRNLITDFVKARGDQISYGAFAKGAGSDNRFEQNIVLCEHLLQDAPGQRVGISLGGGGTGKRYCRDQHCITEQNGGVIQSNMIASCSDDGIYINRAAAIKILHNTLIDTGGITIRFVESSADVQGNLVDGLIRSRDGGLLRATDNFDTSASRLYLGMHPVRSLYVNAAAMVFTWSGKPPRRDGTDTAVPDLCGVLRSPHPTYGAFEDFSACLIIK